jgi:DNA (cytosine-5)-methyltransferase 1
MASFKNEPLLNELSLFTGAGGGVLGTKLLNWRTVGYVEWEKYCQQIISQRIQDGFLDEAPIFGDIDEFIKSGAARKYEGFIDVVTAGFPCQPFSVAGKKRGQDDERNKWPQTLECIRLIRPRYALLENVPGLLNSGYFGEILASLAQIGFDARWTVLGADDVGAPHIRKRLWILAHSISAGTWGNSETSGNEGWRSSNTGSKTLRQGDRSIGSSRPYSASEDVQDPERSGCLHGEHEEEGVQVREQRESGSRSGERVSRDSSQVADSGSSRPAYPSRGEGREEWDGRLHPSEEEQAGQHLRGGIGRCSGVRGEEDVADSKCFGQQGSREYVRPGNPEAYSEGKADRPVNGGEGNEGWWITEPDVGRVAHGVASRVDRLKSLGNGQVPAVAATAWQILTGEIV